MDRKLKTCVKPDGSFSVGLHSPHYRVVNRRIGTYTRRLGLTLEGEPVDNRVNFPSEDLEIRSAQPVYEIPNAFPFWGTTYILGNVASEAAWRDRPVVFSPAGQSSFQGWDEFWNLDLEKVPRPILLAIAQTCSDPAILTKLLPLAAQFVKDADGNVTGLAYERSSSGELRPVIKDHDLFETLGNNPALPDRLKQTMLLIPGVQGTSPIVGEYLRKDECHIYEYLRANSYIPWGHFAANMAEDSIRYSVEDLDIHDVKGLRHLYYQRIFTKLAAELGILGTDRGFVSEEELEELRGEIARHLEAEGPGSCRFSATLWGWNYGYDFSPSGFRLHASHQQIHQQFALVPEAVEEAGSGQGLMPSYAVGDMVEAFVRQYRELHGVSFFNAYIQAIRSNGRTDGNEEAEASLHVFMDEKVLLFVPKAQRFHGELHVVCLESTGNVIEADADTRKSLDKAIFFAVKILSGLGAKMITSFELSKRFFSTEDQRLMYCFIPKHPQSPGAFSEQQGRWITGHFPEDFARSCRNELERIGSL